MSLREVPTRRLACLVPDRASARKCTGPSTREGKTRVALNAVRNVLKAHRFFLILAKSCRARGESWVPAARWLPVEGRPGKIGPQPVFQTKPEYVRKQKGSENVIGLSSIQLDRGIASLDRRSLRGPILKEGRDGCEIVMRGSSLELFQTKPECLRKRRANGNVINLSSFHQVPLNA
jgi:hypothetical protein